MKARNIAYCGTEFFSQSTVAKPQHIIADDTAVMAVVNIYGDYRYSVYGILKGKLSELPISNEFVDIADAFAFKRACDVVINGEKFA